MQALGAKSGTDQRDARLLTVLEPAHIGVDTVLNWVAVVGPRRGIVVGGSSSLVEQLEIAILGQKEGNQCDMLCSVCRRWWAPISVM